MNPADWCDTPIFWDLYDRWGCPSWTFAPPSTLLVRPYVDPYPPRGDAGARGWLPGTAVPLAASLA